jgi:mannose-6-phosphate isomerase-like protein (cupin superfamily)
MTEMVAAEAASSDRDYFDRLAVLSERQGPTVFSLRSRIVKQGRLDMPVAATGLLNIVLKVYGSGGENAVHAHTNEDHAFIVLQGSATFYGADDQVIGTVGQYQGILLPRGTFYRFTAGTAEPLVLLRVAATVPGEGAHGDRRVGTDGDYLDSFSEANKEVEVIYSEGEYFG